MTLTREQIMNMPEGRELDTLVAQHIMELTIVPDGLKYSPRYYLPEYKETYHREVPNYSTNISAALEVVEKMRKNKIYLDIRVWPEEYQVLPHQDEHNKLIEHCIVKSPSLPEAICKAALLASLGESGGTGE